MRIKRYKARDMAAALKLVKDELGSEAVILSTREVKDAGELATMVEITAGAGHQADTAHVPKPTEPELNPAAIRGLEGGLAEIKDLILDLTHRSGLSERLRDRPELLRLYRELLDAELDVSLARALVEAAAGRANGDAAQARSVVAERLTRLLKTGSSSKNNGQKAPRFMALIGPSGVGKTTTAAKLAAHWGIKKQKKVGLISLDSFRLGAAEQLRTYARIMGLPVRTAQGNDEFRQAVDMFENLDMVIIDTSGRVMNQDEARSELTELLSVPPEVGVHLVLPATTKDRDLAAAIEKARVLDPSSLIVTKIDETERYGNVINNLVKYKLPVSFLTNGQKVPDDLVPASPARLAALITAGTPDDSEHQLRKSL